MGGWDFHMAGWPSDGRAPTVGLRGLLAARVRQVESALDIDTVAGEVVAEAH